MKLLTHNMLTSKCLKGVTVGYPLGIVVSFTSIYNFKVNLNKPIKTFYNNVICISKEGLFT